MIYNMTLIPAYGMVIPRIFLEFSRSCCTVRHNDKLQLYHLAAKITRESKKFVSFVYLLKYCLINDDHRDKVFKYTTVTGQVDFRSVLRPLKFDFGVAAARR